MPESRKTLIYWSGQRDSNSRPTAWEAGTLPLSYARKDYCHGWQQKLYAAFPLAANINIAYL